MNANLKQEWMQILSGMERGALVQLCDVLTEENEILRRMQKRPRTTVRESATVLPPQRAQAKEAR